MPEIVGSILFFELIPEITYQNQNDCG